MLARWEFRWVHDQAVGQRQSIRWTWYHTVTVRWVKSLQHSDRIVFIVDLTCQMNGVVEALDPAQTCWERGRCTQHFGVLLLVMRMPVACPEYVYTAGREAELASYF